MYQTNWRKLHQSLKVQFNTIKLENDNLLLQLKHTKLAMEKSEQKLQMLENLIPYGIWSCNARGLLNYVSDTYLNLRGVTLKGYKKSGWAQCFSANEKDRLLKKWQKCVENGDAWEEIYEIMGFDGLTHPILCKGSPIRNSVGHILGWIGLYLNISPKEKAAILSIHMKNS